MIPELVACFDRSITFLRDATADLSDKELIQQPEGFVQNPAWIVGHIIYSCQAMAGELGVEPWLAEDWESKYGTGSSPDSLLQDPPKKSDLLEALDIAVNRLRSALLACDESAMQEPLPDEKCRQFLPTIGHALIQILAAHTAYHAGQLAVWKRAAGRQSAGLFL